MCAQPAPAPVPPPTLPAVTSPIAKVNLDAAKITTPKRFTHHRAPAPKPRLFEPPDQLWLMEAELTATQRRVAHEAEIPSLKVWAAYVEGQGPDPSSALADAPQIYRTLEYLRSTLMDRWWADEWDGESARQRFAQKQGWSVERTAAYVGWTPAILRTRVYMAYCWWRGLDDRERDALYFLAMHGITRAGQQQKLDIERFGKRRATEMRAYEGALLE